MDCAKAVGVRIARPKTHLSKLGGILKVHAKLPLLVAIPTTAGTGSETTLAAVNEDATTRHKNAINDFLDLCLENNDESDQNYNDQNHLNNTHSRFIFKKML